MKIVASRLHWSLVLLILGFFVVGLAGAPAGVASAAPDTPDAPSVPDAPCADLVITNVSVTPAQPTVGQNANIAVTVLNQGTCTSLSFVLQWKSDRFAPTGPSSHVNGLAAGASTTVNFTYAFPNAGNFTTVAIADTDNSVQETNESNNLEIKDVTVLPDMPDLVVTSFSVNPVQPVEGLNAQINITVKNQGTLAAGAFVVQWKSDRFAPTGPTSHVNGLAPGQSANVSFTYAFPNAGNFTTVAIVDSANTVAESDETNNLAILSVTVQTAWIDLEITSFSINPVEPVRDRPAQATITVMNHGNFPAGPFVVQWKPTLFTADYSIQVGGLGPGQSTSVSFTHNYAMAGDFFTSATVDSTNKVAETDESNNTVTMPITVQPPRADLVITSLTINPPQPVRGLNATVSIVVENQGNSPAGVFVVEWKPALLAQGLATQLSGLGVGESTVVTFNHTYTFVGTFNSMATADSTNRVLELDENNNTASLQVTVIQDTVDLLITQMSISPNPPLQGSPATVSINVKNQGNSPSGPFVLEWNPDALGLLTPSPSSLSAQVNNLNGGQSMVVNFQFTYHESGTFRTVANVDAFNNVAETNEANNLAILNVVVGLAAPDLTITAMNIFPGTSCNPQVPKAPAGVEPELIQGRPAAICITVKNQGNVAAGPFILEWNPDAFGLITPSPGTISTQINGLAVGASQQVQFSFIYHQHGNFRTVAMVDAFNNVAESNESNNLDLVNVVVHPGLIDLVITSFTISPSSPIRGSKATASITVRNNGEYPAGNFFVQWRLTGQDGSGPFGQIDGLLPGESKTIQLEGTFFIAGPYTSFAMADVFEQIIETNENNNTATRAVTVQPRVTQLRVTFNSLKIHQAFEDGIDGNAEWVMAFFLLDPDATCSFAGQNIDGVECIKREDGAVEDGDVIPINHSMIVNLVESTPLVLATAAFEVDDFLGIPTDGKFTGAIVQFWSNMDYRGVGTMTVPSVEGPCNNGRCYDLTYTVQIVSEPPPLSNGAQDEPAPEFVVLPDGLSRVLPPSVPMPQGVKRTWQTYLPTIVR